MISPLYVAVFFFFCASAAYGVQKRKRWAWYGGWIFMFFSAGALGLPLAYVASESKSLFSAVITVVGLIGAMLLWVGWAIWWSRRQHDFGIDPKA